MIPRSELLALRPTPLASIDARVKFLLTLLYTLTVVAVPFDRPVFLLPLALPLALALGAGDVPLAHLGFRLLLGLPFVFLVILFPILLQRETVLLTFGETTFPVTRGAVRSAVVAGKFVLAFGAVIVLNSTTGFTRICEAMARLRFPSLFVASVAMTWRYLLLVLGEGARLRRAREARSPRKSSLAASWRSSASIVGSLFLRALDRSERIHAAMEARGYSGNLPPSASSSLKTADWILAASACVFLGGILAAIWMDVS